VVGVGGAVSFNQAPLIVGTAISKTNDTTFTVSANSPGELYTADGAFVAFG